MNPWDKLTPYERKWALYLIEQASLKREAEYYAIHGQKKGRPKEK